MGARSWEFGSKSTMDTNQVQERITMASMDDVEQCCLIPAIEEEAEWLVFGGSKRVEGGGGSGDGTSDKQKGRGEELSKGKDKSAVPPPPLELRAALERSMCWGLGDLSVILFLRSYFRVVFYIV
ncbi:unnamed protein product, partial [Cuscuta epithymum]